MIVRRLTQGLAASVIGQVLGLGMQILLVPLFVSAWGVDVYGEWLLLSSFAGYLFLADAGASVYIVNRLTQAFALDDLASLRRVLHSGLQLFIVGSLILLLVFLVVLAVASPT